MFSLLKKSAAPAQVPTLKTRVDLFWRWYTEVAPRFYATIEAKKCPDLAKEVIAKIDELLPSFAWVFGPGKNKQGHSFTLSGEGVIHRQLITLYWLSRAPKLPGWTFYAARQPDPVVKGKTIKIGDRVFDPCEFWITPTIDAEREKISITAWHPLFDILPEKDRHTILYLFLDELFGEYGTDLCIGQIDLSNKRLTDAIPLAELLDYVNDAVTKNGWKKFPPGQCFTSYKCEPHDRFPRGDIFVGTTSNFPLVTAYLDSEGELADPLDGTGADFVYVSIDASILPAGGQAAARGELEDALEEALQSDFSGMLLGGAHGTQNAYIDLMIFDGNESLAIVQRVLRERKLPAGTEIHFFAKEKRGHRIVL